MNIALAQGNARRRESAWQLNPVNRTIAEIVPQSKDLT
jgi:hypothetical protein